VLVKTVRQLCQLCYWSCTALELFKTADRVSTDSWHLHCRPVLAYFKQFANVLAIA